MILDLGEVAIQLLEKATLIPARLAEREVVDGRGLYAILIDFPRALPDGFCRRLQQRETNLIYVGKAGDSFQRRLVVGDQVIPQPEAL